jgi:hypothetical protein
MLQTDCAVPGYALGDTIYIRGRVVAFCRCPWGEGIQIAATAIGPDGKPLDPERTYWVDPGHAVNAATVKSEVKR